MGPEKKQKKEGEGAKSASESNQVLAAGVVHKTNTRILSRPSESPRERQHHGADPKDRLNDDSIMKDFQPPMPPRSNQAPKVVITPSQTHNPQSSKSTQHIRQNNVKLPRSGDKTSASVVAPPPSAKQKGTIQRMKTEDNQSTAEKSIHETDTSDRDTLDSSNAPLVPPLPAQNRQPHNALVHPSGSALTGVSAGSKSAYPASKIAQQGTQNKPKPQIGAKGSGTVITSASATTPALPTTNRKSPPDLSRLPIDRKSPISLPSEQPAIDETITKLRAPLVSRYGSFIHSSDTSLDDARKRLKTALDQTRILRVAFTERVYEKYRILLKPVPTEVNSIVNGILADPNAAFKRLEEEIRKTKEERELEKKEAQKLAANAAATDGSASISAQESAEQMQFIGAGLNLVILPEEEIDERHAGTLGKYEHRGPINPETGQRVGGISQAAATAAVALLDRARRSALIRSERLRRQQLTGEVGSTETAASPDFSRLHMMSSSALSMKSLNSSKGSPGLKKKGNRSSSAAAHASKAKGRNHVTVGGAGLLTMDPAVEDLDDKKPSASTAALIFHGVGRPPQKQKHPHPDSQGGRRALLAANSCRKSDQAAVGFELPAFIHPKDQRDMAPYTVVDRELAADKRAIKALRGVLGQFTSHPRSKTNNARPDDSKVVREAATVDSAENHKKLRATELGLLQMKWGGGSETDNEKLSTQQDPQTKAIQLSKNSPSTVQTQEPSIEPIVAFSVLLATGVVCDSPVSQRVSGEPPSKRLRNLNLFLSEDENVRNSVSKLDASRRLSDLYKRVLSAKRTFSESLFQEPGTERTKRIKIEEVKPPEGSVPSATSAGLNTREGKIAATRQKLGPDNGDSAGITPKETACPVVSLRGGGDTSNDTIEAVDGVERMAEISEQDRIVQTNQQSGPDALPGPHEMPEPDRIESPDLDEQSDAILSEVQEKHLLGSRPQSAPSSASRLPPAIGPQSAAAISQRARPSSSSSAQTSQSVWNEANRLAILSNQMMQSRAGMLSGNGPAGAFSPPRNNSTNSLAAGIQGQSLVVPGSLTQTLASSQELFNAQNLQLQQAAAMNSIHKRHAGSDMNDFFTGTMQSGAGTFGANRSDWSPAGLNLMQQHPQLAALGLTPQDAMLSVRDQAARALLARQQQQNMAAAAHAAVVQRQAALRGGTGVGGLSQQQAAILMGQAGAGRVGLFPNSAPNGAQIAGYGTQSAATAAIMGNPTASALMNTTAHLTALQQQISAGSRPGSHHSPPAPKGPPLGTATKEPPVAKKTTPPEDVEFDKIVELATSDPPADSKESNDDHDHGVSFSSLEDLLDTSQNTRTDASSPEEGEAEKTEKAKAPNGPKTVPCKTVAPGNKAKGVADSDKSAPSTLPPTGLAATSGMQFFVPPTQPGMKPELASLVLSGRVHVAFERVLSQNGNASSAEDAKAVLDYLQAVGSAVPIPKGLVSAPLKEKLNPQAIKNSNSGWQLTQASREVIVATILVWLWVLHKGSFQRAFAKSGRTDVDPECKWLIQAAVEAASRAVVSQLDKSQADSSLNIPPKGKLSPDNEASLLVDIRIVSIVNEALMMELCVDKEVDNTLSINDDLVELLDETRLLALKARCRERAMLAALVARTTTMAEPFAHAYTSCMVRAGDALGHGELFETVQSDDTMTSTMIPYDIFSDEMGAWEDPCRVPNGFTPGLKGDDLVRRAHARAMIQKSLKKMQDRNNIRGGAGDAGAYTEPSFSQTQQEPASAVQKTPGGSRRRGPFSFSGEAPIKPGTGAGKARSRSQYSPNHHSVPLVWDNSDIQNKPYGRYAFGTRPKILALSRMQSQEGRRRRGRGSSRPSIASPSIPVVPSEARRKDGSYTSTEEVEWGEVAGIFEVVASTTPSSKRAKRERPEQIYDVAPASKTIFAPFCNKIDDSELKAGDSDSDEEDLSDEAILGRHQVVLDKMKEKLDKFIEHRQTVGQRARSRAAAGRAAAKADSGKT